MPLCNGRNTRAHLAAVGVVVLLTACASGGGVPQVRTSVHTEPAAQPAQAGVPLSPAPAAGTLEPNTPTTLPQLPGTQQPAVSGAPVARIRVIDVPSGTPIATAVSQIGSQLGLTVNVDPEVRGTANGDLKLRNVTLDDALKELVSRNGYAYQLQGSVLRVVPVRMQTKTFTLDYVALSRVGTMSTVVQRRLSSGGAGPVVGTASGLSTSAAGAIAGGAGGGDVLSAQSVADIWQEIKVSLTGIMQAGQQAERAAGTPNAPPATVQSAAGGGVGAGASSTPFGDGSSLVISPMSGLINVTAMPDKLAAVESFINQFQSSVLRQVLIEAKIVEVSLSNTFQYGVDWSVVTSTAAGTSGVTLRSDPSVQTTGNAGTVNFTLQNGATQVNAVLTALSTQGTVNVLSNEQTTALNNQRAIFNVTTDEVFFSVTRTPLFGANGGVVSIESQIIPQQISVGVVLDVLPQISADNVLTMNIRPAVTNIDHIATITTSDGTSASAPVIARREGDTIARLRAGETMIIGGLVQTRKENTVSGIPVLKDLPLIGKVFQRINTTETRSELVVFLTPTIISGQPVSIGGGR